MPKGMRYLLNIFGIKEPQFNLQALYINERLSPQFYNRGMRILLVTALVLNGSCATAPSHQSSELQEQTAESSSPESGCMKDTDCREGKVCATIKGEYPGSCADKGSPGELLGAIAVGAMAAAAVAASQNNSGGGGGGSNYRAPSYAVPGQSSAGDCQVSGYYNQYGTWVQDYTRSCPDNSKANNYGRPSSGSTGLYDRDLDGDGLYNQYDMDDDGDGIFDQYDTQ